MVVNKPQGIAVEEARSGASVMAMLHAQLGPLRGNNILQNVHRLDKPVSGTLLIARKASMLKLLSAQFAERGVSKTYLAITDKAPAAADGILTQWLAKDNLNRRAIVKDKAFKEASEVKLEYKLLGSVAGKHLLEINLLTGKYHQIRAQLAHIGCPIIGDTLYGSQSSYVPDAIGLHARALDFIHPATQAPVLVTAPVPDDALWGAFGSLIH